MIDARFVPMERPAKLAPIKSLFKSTYSQSLDLLEAELKHLGATQITIQAGFPREKIRNDGWPFAGAVPTHPACAVEFMDRKRRQLVFRGVRYAKFADNIRAIAKTLEALRTVDRYGVVEGEQYAGFKQLGSGQPPSPVKAFMDRMEAALWLASVAVVPKDYILDNEDLREEAIRRATKKLHPDAGGSHEEFVKLQEVIRALRQ